MQKSKGLGSGQMRLALFLLAVSLVCAKEDYFKQANALYDAGKFRESVPFYRAAIKHGELEPFAWFNLGNALVHLNQNAVAMTAYKRSAELAPHFAKPWVLLGDLSYTYGDYGQSIVYYGRALELKEKNEHIYYALASSYLKLREFVLAERYFEQTVNENQDNLAAWFGLSECAQKTGDYARAAHILQKALQKTVSVPADLYYTLAYYYLEQDSIKQATMAMENGLYLDEKNTEARRYLASLYIKANSPWMAIFTLEQGIKLSDKNRGVLELDLGEIYFKQNRYSDAFEHYKNALKAGNKLSRIGIENVGNALHNLGDSLLAKAAYKLLTDD